MCVRNRLGFEVGLDKREGVCMMIPNPNRRIYEEHYDSSDLTLASDPDSYDRKMVQIRLDLVRKYSSKGKVLDLCCGSGSYLKQLAEIPRLVGVDFSAPLLREVNSQAPRKFPVVLGDAMVLPFQSTSFDLVFSFAALYYVPQLDRCLQEVERVMAPGGHAILELGNQWSLNTILSDYYHRTANWAQGFHVSVGTMRKLFRDLQFDVVDHRCFQLLPMYGGPRWSWPWSSAKWKSFLKNEWRGKMWDERLSTAPCIQHFAFRHLWVLRKP
jgi:ubiquinone/menaquinone biosynthesis C-methylase UbiE